MWTGSSSSSEQDAPIMVIIIAVVVGGLITSFCVGAVAWTICKTLKKKDKDGLMSQTQVDEDGNPIPNEEEEESEH